MISRLPGWVWIGGSLLAFIAGMINAVGFLGFTHEAITHLTGTATLAALALSAGNSGALLMLLLMGLSFLLGAVVSGFIIQESTLKLGRRYGVALAIESLLLFAAIPLLGRGFFLGECLAAGACGLQNAMASSYSGAVIRTTHISGMVTDLGIIVGHWCRGLPPDTKRIRLYSSLIAGFVAGGVAGGLLFPGLHYHTLLIPAILTGGAALLYTLYEIRNG